jgi:hypothetical protein
MVSPEFAAFMAAWMLCPGLTLIIAASTIDIRQMAKAAIMIRYLPLAFNYLSLILL